MAKSKRNLKRKFQFSTQSLLLVYGSVALLTWLPLTILISDTSPVSLLVFLATSLMTLVPAAAVFAGQYFLAYLPLKKIQAHESDPLLVSALPSYPFFGLRAVHFVLGLYGDFKLQRDAFQRLTESYRNLCLAEPEVTLRSLLRLPIENELATGVTLKLFDPNLGTFTEVQELPVRKLAERTAFLASRNQGLNGQESHQKQPDEVKEDLIKLKLELEQTQRRGERDFVFQNKLYVFQDFESTADEGAPEETQKAKFLLVLEVLPRRLWTRFPKIYRRFFHAMVLALLRKDRAAQPQNTNGDNQDNSLARDFLAAQNLSRIFVDTDHATKLLPPCLGIAHRPAAQVYGDFIAVSHNRSLHETIALVGNIPGKEPLSGLAAHAALAVLSAELTRIKGTAPSPQNTSHAKLHALVSAVHQFVFNMYLGKLGVELSALLFDHHTGNGEFVSFGQPFPYLLSPNERKPLVLGPQDPSTGMLGISPEFSFSPTSFSLLPGQILIVCTAGILGVRDHNNKSFEKEVSRGKLSSFTSISGNLGNQYSATKFANTILQLATEHMGNRPLQDDLSLVCLAPYQTFAKSNQDSSESSDTPLS